MSHGGLTGESTAWLRHLMDALPFLPASSSVTEAWGMPWAASPRIMEGLAAMHPVLRQTAAGLFPLKNDFAEDLRHVMAAISP